MEPGPTAATAPVEAPTVRLSIDGEDVTVDRGRRLIEAAREHGSYVPGWCHHPSMRPATQLRGAGRVYRPPEGPVAVPPKGVRALEEAPSAGGAVRGAAGPFGGCGLCVVEVDGVEELACEARARTGMEVMTATDAVRERQREVMAELFRHHPHACLDCPQKEGCDRITCSMNVPEEARCCDLIGDCELEKSAGAIGLDWTEVPAYESLDRPAQRTPVFDVNWELCIGCARCVGVCEDHVGAGVWRFSRESGAAGEAVTVGLKAETLTKSGCKFCTACVAACPTGALSDNGAAGDPRLPLEFRESLARVAFPGTAMPLSTEMIREEVPAAGGVYVLYDGEGEVVAIRGVADLAEALRRELDAREASEFEFELDENFTRRETELIERYVTRHGHMPGAGAMDDLF